MLGEVVLTGGGALLPGIEPIAEEVFGLPVRVGVPPTVRGLTDAMKQPQYATAIGSCSSEPARSRLDAGGVQWQRRITSSHTHVVGEI